MSGQKRVIVHLVRHAEGTHNVPGAVHTRDPDLTDRGRAQCAEMARTFPHHDRLVLLAASPMRRTLETCLRSFYEMSHDDAAGDAAAAPPPPPLPPVVALPGLQEAGVFMSDLGSDVEALRAAFEGRHVDLSRVDPGWELKGPGTRAEPTLFKLEARAAGARQVLRELARTMAREKGSEGEGEGEVHLAVLSHGGFLHFLTGDWHGIEADRVTGWNNMEYRSYEFVNLDGDDAEASLAETPESWTRRRGSLSKPTSTELAELRAVLPQRILSAWSSWW